jgi:hypothetical protein
MPILRRLVPNRALTTGLAAVALTFAWQSLTVHCNYSGNWTALFCTGGNLRVPPSLAWEGIYLFPNSNGYDGQFYHFQAHDPFLRKGLAEYMDAPRLRYRRMLVPTAAYLLAGGQDRLVDTTFFGVIWLSVFLGAYWVSRSAGHLGWHPAWGLCFLLVPATLISIDRMTVDLTLTALTAGFAYYAREGPSWRLGTVLACAALTRETGVLLLAGYGLYLLSRRLWARAILFAAAGAPLLVWLGFLEKAMRGVHPDTGFPYRTGAPFGICLFMSPPYPGPEILAWILRALDYLVMTGVLLAAFLAVRHVLKRPRTPEGFVAWMFVLMLVPIVTVFNLYDPYTYPRLISPLLVLVALQELPARAWLGLLPLAFLSARAAVQLGTQVVGIWRGFVGG